MTIWRLLYAQLRGVRLTLLLATLATGGLDAVFVVSLAGMFAGHAGWVPLTGTMDLLAVIAVLQLAQAWIGRQAALQFAALSRRIRRVLLAAYLDLEPAARPAIPLADLKDGLTALPRHLSRLQAEAALGLSSLAGDLACMAATVLLAPAAGAALLLAVKSQAVLLLAQVPRLRSALTAAQAAEDGVDLAIGDLLGGFQGALLDPRGHADLRGPAITAALAARHRARDLYRARLATREALSGAVRLLSAAAVTFVTLLAGSPTAPAAMLFVIALLVPLEWMRAVPFIASTSAGSERLAALEQRLQAEAAAAPPPPARPAAPFTSLELRDIGFAYPARPGLPGAMIGPLSCRAEAGRVIFITGRRGSGKSTLLQLICGAMAPHMGAVLINGRSVEGRSSRGLAAFVPMEPELPPDSLGGEAAAEIQAMLAEHHLQDAVRLEGGRLAAAGLSRAQAKRLALVCAIAQHRPILALDEWAAGQDPAQCERFYTETIPKLRDQGVAVVLTTQDERYFYVADEIVRLRDGMRIG